MQASALSLGAKIDMFVKPFSFFFLISSSQFPGVSTYCMSKACMDQFTRTTALELASHKVRVNSVNPGVIKTEVHKRGGMSEEDYAKVCESKEEVMCKGLRGFR